MSLYTEYNLPDQSIDEPDAHDDYASGYDAPQYFGKKPEEYTRCDLCQRFNRINSWEQEEFYGYFGADAEFCRDSYSKDCLDAASALIGRLEGDCAALEKTVKQLTKSRDDAERLVHKLSRELAKGYAG